MIDSHCHLDHEPLLSNLTEVIERSKKVGLEKILTISTSKESFSRIKEILKKDDMIYGTVGIHPHETDKNLISSEEIVKHINENKKIIGIGETGLDFFYNNSKKDTQISSFEKHIKASIETNAPLIIHSRNAEAETYDTLYKYRDYKLKILMHCFTGSQKFAENLFELNAFFSASGIITFKNSIDLQKTFQIIPLNKIMIETDSPFLAPVPNRGKKNEPSFITYTAKKLSEIRNISLSELIKLTTNNFNKLFFA